MAKIEFVSHHSFPDDQYTKELVYLCIDEKYRVAYVRKASKNGGMFWAVVSLGVSQNGSKVYFEAFLQDSSFLEKDIKDFLEKRKWEASAPVIANAQVHHVPVASSAHVDFPTEDLPF